MKRSFLILLLLFLFACGDETGPTTVAPSATPAIPPTRTAPAVSPTPVINKRLGYANGPVAKVGPDTISAIEFNQALDQTRVTFEEQMGGAVDWSTSENQTHLKEMRDQVLDGLVNYYVLEQQAKKENISATDDEVTTRLNDFKQQMGGENAYQDWLRKTFMTDADYRQAIRQGLIFEKMEEKHATADENGEQVKARHILLATQGEAQDMYKRLQQGADFAALARQFSLDTTTAKNGGELDWVFKGQTDADFEKVLFGLKVGEISGPVKSGVGWHIIQVTAHEVRPLPFDLVQQNKAAAFGNYIKSLRDKTTIEILLK